METTTITALLIGTIAGVVAVGVMLPSLSKRLRARHGAELRRLESEIADLRQELAQDREVNRRLRRELVINTPESLELTREERDRALDELGKLSAELQGATLELADRDRSLREARMAIHEIRVQLERNRFAGEESAAAARQIVDQARQLVQGDPGDDETPGSSSRFFDASNT
ncbi:MAG: hypothetical protein ACFCVK_11855 [Acidimicrobiales bacterium]